MNFLQDVPMKTHQYTNALVAITLLWVMSSPGHCSMAKTMVLNPWLEGPVLFQTAMWWAWTLYARPRAMPGRELALPPCRQCAGPVSPWSHQPPSKQINFAVISSSSLSKMTKKKNTNQISQSYFPEVSSSILTHDKKKRRIPSPTSMVREVISSVTRWDFSSQEQEVGRSMFAACKPHHGKARQRGTALAKPSPQTRARSRKWSKL